MKVIGQKIEGEVTVFIYESAPIKYGLSCRNKTSTKVTRAELSKIQCKPEGEKDGQD
jgi:hypothetical protein